MSIILQRPVHKLPSPFIYAQRDAAGNSMNVITQAFGENLAPFYKQMGMKGHNGIDFISGTGAEIYAAHDGEVFKTLDKDNSSPTAGYGVYIRHAEGWWTLYFHLLDVTVKVGDRVKAGDLIGHSDNTGQYTTGPHLHFGLYPADKDRDRNNGYDGAIDPMPYFTLEAITGKSNSSNQNNMNKLKTIRRIGESETFVVIAGKNYYIAKPETFERLKKEGIIGDWNEVQEVATHIPIDGIID